MVLTLALSLTLTLALTLTRYDGTAAWFGSVVLAGGSSLFPGLQVCSLVITPNSRASSPGCRSGCARSHISPYLPRSPHISPISPYISPQERLCEELAPLGPSHATPKVTPPHEATLACLLAHLLSWLG